MDTQNLRVEDLAAISSQSAGNIATQIHTPEMVRPSKTPHPPTPSSPQYGDTGRRVCSSCGAMNSASQETCRNCKAVLHTPTPKVISPNVPSNEVANGFAKANPSAFLKPKPPALKPSTAKVIATPPPGQIIQEPMSYQWVLYIFWILLGMVVFPVTMLPVFKGCPTSVYAWDIVAGAIASFFLIYSQHAILAGIIFELIAIVSWVGKWLSASVSVEFFSQKMGLFIIALILVFLLGINLGLISKKIIPQKKLS